MNERQLLLHRSAFILYRFTLCFCGECFLLMKETLDDEFA
jgi:hypothetical protein